MASSSQEQEIIPAQPPITGSLGTTPMLLMSILVLAMIGIGALHFWPHLHDADGNLTGPFFYLQRSLIGIAIVATVLSIVFVHFRRRQDPVVEPQSQVDRAEAEHSEFAPPRSEPSIFSPDQEAWYRMEARRIYQMPSKGRIDVLADGAVMKAAAGAFVPAWVYVEDPQPFEDPTPQA